MDSYMQRAWAEVNLDAIESNLKNIRALTRPEAKIMAVVKADAYGHGFLQVVKTLLKNGADALGVAVIDEAKQLRSRGIDVPILILGNTHPGLAEDLIDFDVMPTVFTYELARAVSDAAVKKNKDAKIHIKIDTGMSRIGYVYNGGDMSAIAGEIARIAKLPNLEIDGIFTHFPCADEESCTETQTQFERFMALCDCLEAQGIHIPVKHACNSAALVCYPHMHLDMVRPGVILYGMHPADVTKDKITLEPAMSLKARVTMVKEVDADVGVSYGKKFVTSAPTKVATIPIGYADGYSRTLTGKAGVLYEGKILPVIGRICMDQCMIDATSVNNISVDDIVTVMGRNLNHALSADDLAKYMGTINYEVVCIIGKRIPRVYVSGGSVVRALNNLV